jgi:hypothetical protein
VVAGLIIMSTASVEDVMPCHGDGSFEIIGTGCAGGGKTEA